MPILRRQILGLGFFAAVVVYATWPGDDTLNYSSCEPKGSLAEISANIYGRFFWERALTRARALANMKTIEDYQADADRINKEGEQRLEELYLKYPSVAPSPAERRAQSLRDEADRLEAQDGLDRIASMQRATKAKAENCVYVISQRLRNN